MHPAWLDELISLVERRPIAVLRLDEAEWLSLMESRKGVGEFTTALPHVEFDNFKAPTLCLILTRSDRVDFAYLGLIGARSAITTLQSRIKIRRAREITPASPAGLSSLIPQARHRRALSERLRRDAAFTLLSPKLSGVLLHALAQLRENVGPMRSIEAMLTAPKSFRSNKALQDDAIRVAMRAFGLAADDQARELELIGEDSTGLARIPIIEDGVIEHNARYVQGFELTASEMTGRAVFTRGNERLEIITANRRQLEHAFGVDLIYLNVIRRNLVMLQYKMLEPGGRDEDWIFTPDDQLEKELSRMRLFAQQHSAPVHEYRLNPATFYMKFVKRNGAIRKGGIILPIDHYDRFIESPAARGPRGGLRIGFNALDGSYMREAPFLDLIRGGYIGAYSTTSEHLMTLVDAVVARGRAVVAAIQSSVRIAEGSEDPGDRPEDYLTR